MAGERREGQGLQVAVIIFAMLTIILAVTTYIFYAQGQTALKEKEAAEMAVGQKQQEYDKMFYKVRAMQYMLGLATKPEMEDAKKGLGEDQEVAALLRNFDSDMALVADQVAATEKRDYRTVASILINVVSKKNSSVTDANNQTRDISAKAAAAIATETARTKTFEEAATKAADDTRVATEDYNKARTEIAGEKTKLEQQIAVNSKKAKEDADKAAKLLNDSLAVQSTYATTLQAQAVRIKELEVGQQDLFENPDGKINWVNQKQQLVWLNVGRGDGLMRQTTFAVYDHDQNGVASAEPKARIEVVEVSGDHLAEARILEDSAANPILPGDIIHTPSWSPGQRIHFAMAGKMDIDGDGLDDYERVRSIIQLNGGVIDAELRPDGSREGRLSVNTRYLVLGDRPDDTDRDNAKLLAEFTNITTEITRYGIDVIPIQKLLALMGWKSEEKTVELAGSRGQGEFRKRLPGKTGAPAATPAPGTPAPATTPAPAGGFDPFATPAPGAAPATPATPPADPFATPAAPAPAAPAPAAPATPPADPFGTP
jgi:hypothetical protein